MLMNFKFINLFFVLLPLTLSNCNPQSRSLNDLMVAATGKRALYVASGACYGGGVTTSAGASTIAAFDPDTGVLRRVVVDYNSMSPGDAPVAISEFDASHLLVLVENAFGRRVDLVSKDGSGVTTYLTNSTALSAVTRSMARLSDNSLLISKSSAIEKFSPGKSRVLQAASSYVNAPGLTCATSTTLISGVTATANSKIIFSHAAATPNNKIAMISAAGYATTADCLTAQAAPTTLAMPTSVLIHSSGNLLVAYGSTTAASNFIYSYNLDTTANTITAPVAAYFDTAVVNGPTAMAEDAYNGAVFVANGASSFNTIEKFSFDPVTKTLTHPSGPPFLPAQIYTRCVSDMKVLSE
jgi:hypothetical protein